MNLKARMRLWDWKAVSVFASICAVALAGAALVVALVALPEAGVDTTPTASDGHTIEIVPATGEQGFPAELFCSDPETAVSLLLVPDGSGETYQLVRVRNLVPEAVVWPSMLAGPYDDEDEAAAESIAGQIPQQGPDGKWYNGPPSGYNPQATFYYFPTLEEVSQSIYGKPFSQLLPDERLAAETEASEQKAVSAVISEDAAKCILEKAQ